MATKLPYVLPFEDGAEVAAILLKAQGLPEKEQIATKTELQQATAYLATLDNATMAPQSATVKRTTDSLQAQIDNIVRAPESGGDVGAEVYQARVGADGTIYQTLKERLDADVESQAAADSDIEDILMEAGNRTARNEAGVNKFVRTTEVYSSMSLGTPTDPASNTTRMYTTIPCYIKAGTILRARPGFKFGTYSITPVIIQPWTTEWTATQSIKIYIAVKADDESDFTNIYAQANISQYVYGDAIFGLSGYNSYILDPASQHAANVYDRLIDTLFSDYDVIRCPLILGNPVDPAQLDNPERLSLPNAITLHEGTVIEALDDFEFGLWDLSTPNVLITGGWAKRFVVPYDMGAKICLRKATNDDFTDVYETLSLYDCIRSSELIGYYIKKYPNVPRKPYKITSWYNYGLHTALQSGVERWVLDKNPKRLCNLLSYENDWDLQPGDVVRIRLLDKVNYKYAFELFQRNQPVGGYWAYTTNDVEITITQPSYLGVMMATADGDTNIPVSAAQYIDVTIIPQTTTDLPWAGNSAVFVGDSITYGVNTTAGNRYWELLQNLCGFIAEGMGVAGSCYSVTSDYGQQNSPISTRWNTVPEKDLIVLFAGTNDYGHGTPLGTIADTTDISFYGALNIVFGGLANKYPRSRIVIMTPLHRYGFGGLTYDTDLNNAGQCLKDYVDAIKAVARKYSLPVIDTFAVSGLNPELTNIKNTYVTDGLHPNAAGHHLLAKRICELLNNC